MQRIAGLAPKKHFFIKISRYYSTIGDIILSGDGINLDFETETITKFGRTEIVKKKLEQLLKEVILPNQDFKIARR